MSKIAEYRPISTLLNCVLLLYWAMKTNCCFFILIHHELTDMWIFRWELCAKVQDSTFSVIPPPHTFFRWSVICHSALSWRSLPVLRELFAPAICEVIRCVSVMVFTFVTADCCTNFLLCHVSYCPYISCADRPANVTNSICSQYTCAKLFWAESLAT